MEIRGRYYFIMLLACFAVAKSIDLYQICPDRVKKDLQLTFLIILIMTTIFNLVTNLARNNLGKSWYNDYSVFEEEYIPFRIYNFSWIMLISFVFVKIMSWCDTHLTHKI